MILLYVKLDKPPFSHRFTLIHTGNGDPFIQGTVTNVQGTEQSSADCSLFVFVLSLRVTCCCMSAVLEQDL